MLNQGPGIDILGGKKQNLIIGSADGQSFKLGDPLSKLRDSSVTDSEDFSSLILIWTLYVEIHKIKKIVRVIIP